MTASISSDVLQRTTAEGSELVSTKADRRWPLFCAQETFSWKRAMLHFDHHWPRISIRCKSVSLLLFRVTGGVTRVHLLSEFPFVFIAPRKMTIALRKSMSSGSKRLPVYGNGNVHNNLEFK